MADLTREEYDAKLKTVGAETDTKIARMEGKLDLVLSKLDNVNQNYLTNRSNMLVGFLGIAVLIVAVVALFPVFFDIGSKVRDMISSEVHSQVQSSVTAPAPKQQ